MKVLLSAYACAPGLGSEPEVGLQALSAALSRHEVWVLTQPHFVERLRPWLAQHPHGDRAHVHAVHPPATHEQAGLVALARTQLRHEQWQRAAGRLGRELHAQVRFDVVHHATLAAYWMRTGVALVDAPLVWGPVGGAVEAPARLWGELGVAGAAEDAVRGLVRRASWLRPAVRAAAGAADAVLVQNPATARRLSGGTADVRVLPNALCATVSAVDPAPRRNDVAVVSRLVAWKGVRLAVRALALLPDRSVVLRVYGDPEGSEAARVLTAAARAGVADRVDLVGKLPRADLLQAVATSGVVLHPSLHDEASFTVAEALSVGTPVVCLDHGGPPSVAAHFDRALWRAVRPGGPATTASRLAVAVQELLDPDREVRATPVRPSVDFATALLDAYDRAVAARRAG